MADRHPAAARRQGAAGVVEVAGVAGSGSRGVQGVGAAVAVGVKVQVGQQFVARAAGGRAAHPGHCVGESGGIGGGSCGRGIASHLYTRTFPVNHPILTPVTVEIVSGGAVPVQVVAHGVKLGQVANLNQPVAIAVIVNLDGALDGHIKAAVLQARVLAGRAEVPGVVISVGGAVAVHIHIVPGGVDARRAVGGGGLQVVGTMAGAGAGSRVAVENVGSCRVPIAVGHRSIGVLAAH